MESIFVVTYNHATGEFQVDDSLADANFSDGVWHKEGEGFTKDLSGEENQTDVVAGTLLKSLIQEQNKIKPGFARAQFVWDLSTFAENMRKEKVPETTIEEELRLDVVERISKLTDDEIMDCTTIYME